MNTKYSGYMGKVMAIDLTTRTAEEYPWSDKQRELFIGGKIRRGKAVDRIAVHFGSRCGKRRRQHTQRRKDHTENTFDFHE